VPGLCQLTCTLLQPNGIIATSFLVELRVGSNT